MAGEVDTPYRYTSQRWEENDALDIYYYKARWYDPALGRFLQPDTIVPSAANPQSLNRYSYASNNPVRYNDPSGHWAHIVVGAAVGAIIGAGSVAAPQMIKNIREGQPLMTNIDGAEVAKAAAVGAVTGAVGAATFGAATAVMGTGFAATVGAGAVTGAVTGQVSRAADNVVNEREVTAGLGNVQDIVVDATVGAVAAGVSYGARQLIQLARQSLPKGFADAEKLTKHFQKHGADFGCATEEEYKDAAMRFVAYPGRNALVKVRGNGDIVVFNPVTNEFAVTAPDGTIRTYFIPSPSGHGAPTNLDYFDRQ